MCSLFYFIIFECFILIAVLLTEVMEFILKCNDLFYLFSREQRPSTLAHKIWSYRTRSQLRYWWKNSFPGSSEYCKKVAYLYVLLLFFRLGTADLVPSTPTSLSNTDFCCCCFPQRLISRVDKHGGLLNKNTFLLFLFSDSKHIQILLSSWVTVLKLISHIGNLL